MNYSPAESSTSFQGDINPSLFDVATPFSTNTMNTSESGTPNCTDEATTQPSQLPTVPEDKAADGNDKKPTKKRKSWGQVLPEPKTNLPPRKRAKTADEKEQRRVERVLRNRRAAQSSRERKRQEVELLEQRNLQLQTICDRQQQLLRMALGELHELNPNSGTASLIAEHGTEDLILASKFFPPAEPTENQDKPTPNEPVADGELTTVDPAALSPSSSAAYDDWETSKPQQTLTSSVETQLPAVMLCDLPCPPEEFNALLSMAMFLSLSSLRLISMTSWKSKSTLPTFRLPIRPSRIVSR